jgi:hypothetical protein
MASEIVPYEDGEQLPALTDRQQAFLNAYLANGFNATQAAITVGYAAEFASNAGYRLTSNDDVRAHVRARLDAESMTAEEVLHELTAVAKAPTSHFQQVLQAHYVDDKGREHPAIIRQDYSSKIKALELIGKQRGMFREQIDVSVTEVRTIIGINLDDV